MNNYNDNIDEFEGINDIEETSGGVRKKLPHEAAVLTLGILSIVTCWVYGIIGIILAIIALSLHKTDRNVYETDRSLYQLSFNQSNAGKICAIIGLIFSILVILFTIVFVMIFIGSRGSW